VIELTRVRVRSTATVRVPCDDRLPLWSWRRASDTAAWAGVAGAAVGGIIALATAVLTHRWDAVARTEDQRSDRAEATAALCRDVYARYHASAHGLGSWLVVVVAMDEDRTTLLRAKAKHARIVAI
jgi:hypothetical protein